MFIVTEYAALSFFSPRIPQMRKPFTAVNKCTLYAGGGGGGGGGGNKAILMLLWCYI